MKLYRIFVPIDGKFDELNFSEQWLTPDDVKELEKSGYIVREK